MNEVLLLYSGGLDSRLATIIMKERGYSVKAVFFRLPFSKDKPVNDSFLDQENIPLSIFDCTRGENLNKYLRVLKYPKYPRGAGFNPCLDCKVFMVKELENYAAKKGIKTIATGEVPGQRPMSQTSSKMKTLAEHTEMDIIRPLAEQGIHGRSRKKQMALADKYGIDYPSPAGGCLLCEKELKTRFKILINRDLINEKTLALVNIGRHFYFPENVSWFVVGRDKKENDILELFQNVIHSASGRPAVFYHSEKHNDIALREAKELQLAYQNKEKDTIRYYTEWKI
jgi:predicted subunit of tRNA(5-methylaminomethyl-2-thiouridylate) methyltransferase